MKVTYKVHTSVEKEADVEFPFYQLKEYVSDHYPDSSKHWTRIAEDGRAVTYTEHHRSGGVEWEVAANAHPTLQEAISGHGVGSTLEADIYSDERRATTEEFEIAKAQFDAFLAQCLA